MQPETTNLFAYLAPDRSAEVITTLLERPALRIERIVSLGQSSPADLWYDQEDHEWVVVLKGKGAIEYPNGHIVELAAGDCIDIPAHQKHRVAYTDPENETLWLAIHYK
tara:strand:- start:142 stop:468 length:327 start_codon:yes stop_codon:yes gene_type:complete